MKDMTQKVELLCPVCGNSLFEYPDGIDENNIQDDTLLKCSDCGHEFTKAEIIDLNGEVINNSVEELKKAVSKELKKELKKVFRR